MSKKKKRCKCASGRVGRREGLFQYSHEDTWEMIVTSHVPGSEDKTIYVSHCPFCGKKLPTISYHTFEEL